MERREYFILKGDGKTFERVQNAKPVSNPFGIDLFIHKNMPAVRYGFRWTVTEGETGAAFAHGDTKKEAIANAIKEIEKRGMEQVLKVIASLLFKYGHSPRYRQHGACNYGM